MANELPTAYPAWITPDICVSIDFEKNIAISDSKQQVVLTLDEYKALLEKTSLLFTLYFETSI